ncbi:MAG: MATE family efflux transporter [SAR324 cluster bacterium]
MLLAPRTDPARKDAAASPAGPVPAAAGSAGAAAQGLPPVPTYTEMGRFTLPIVLGLATYALQGLLDAAFVGQLGTAPLAALAMANVTYITGMVVLLGMMRSAMTFLAQAYGAGSRASLGEWVSQYQWLALTSLPILLLAAQGFPWVAQAANLSPGTAAAAGLYLNIRVWEVPFALTTVLYGTLYTATGRSAFPMAVQWGAVALNVALNYGLTLGHLGFPRLGVVGSATSTLASQVAAAATMIGATYLGPMRRRHGLRLLRRPHGRTLLRILAVGFPQGLGDGLELAAFLAFFTIVGWLGEAAVAASNIGLQVTQVLYMPAIATGIAAASYAGRFIGAGAPGLVRITTHRILRATALYMGGLGIPLWFLGASIAGWFIADAEVVRQAGSVFKVMAVYQVFDALGIVLRIALSGAGDVRFPMAAVGVCGAAVMVPLSWWLSLRVQPGILGAWLGMLGYIVALGAVLLWRFERGAWMRMGVLGGTGGQPGVLPAAGTELIAPRG